MGLAQRSVIMNSALTSMLFGNATPNPGPMGMARSCMHGGSQYSAGVGCLSHKGDVDRILSFSHVGHTTTNYGHVKNGHSMNMHGGASPSSFSDKGALVQ